MLKDLAPAGAPPDWTRLHLQVVPGVARNPGGGVPLEAVSDQVAAYICKVPSFLSTADSATAVLVTEVPIVTEELTATATPTAKNCAVIANMFMI